MFQNRMGPGFQGGLPNGGVGAVDPNAPPQGGPAIQQRINDPNYGMMPTNIAGMANPAVQGLQGNYPPQIVALLQQMGQANTPQGMQNPSQLQGMQNPNVANYQGAVDPQTGQPMGNNQGSASAALQTGQPTNPNVASYQGPSTMQTPQLRGQLMGGSQFGGGVNGLARYYTR